MKIAFVCIISFIAFEGLMFAVLPDMVKKMISEAPSDMLLVAGLVEAGAAVALFARLLAGKL